MKHSILLLHIQLTSTLAFAACALDPQDDSEGDVDASTAVSQGSNDNSETGSGTVGESESGASGDNTTTTSTAFETTTSDGASETMDSHGSSSSDSTTAVEPFCPNSAGFACTVPPHCYDGGPETTHCGEVNSWYDATGCPRIDCTKNADVCPLGMRCHQPYAECGICAEVNLHCEDFMLDGELLCGCGGDGSCGGAFCLDEIEFPPGYCGER